MSEFLYFKFMFGNRYMDSALHNLSNDKGINIIILGFTYFFLTFSIDRNGINEINL